MEYIRLEGIIGLIIVIGILLAIVAVGPHFSSNTQTGPSNFKVLSAELFRVGNNYIINATIEASGIPEGSHDNLYEVILNGTTYYAFYKESNKGQVRWYYNGTRTYYIFYQLLILHILRQQTCQKASTRLLLSLNKVTILLP